MPDTGLRDRRARPASSGRTRCLKNTPNTHRPSQAQAARCATGGRRWQWRWPPVCCWPAAVTVQARQPRLHQHPSPRHSRGSPSSKPVPLLGGIDADDDGVRDDIALHIERTYSDPVQRRTAMQMARALQATLLVDKRDHLALREVSDAGDRAIACVRRVAFAGDANRLEGSRLLRELESMTTNTRERLEAYLAYNKAMSGSASVGPEGSVCE